MSSSPVAVRLEVSPAGGVVNATLTFKNTSDVVAYVEKINGCLEGGIENDVFHIETGGQEVDYTGTLAKRRPPGPDDFVKLPPKQEIATSVRLTDAYDFLAGTHRYKAYYSALHAYPDRPGFTELKSDEVTFTFTK